MHETFGIFVRLKRKEQGITLRNFANEIGISPVYESNIEKGIRTAPNGETVEKIAKVLSLDIEDKNKLFDLASETKNDITIPYDICCYINDNRVVKNAIRLALEKNVSLEKWKEFISSIS